MKTQVNLKIDVDVKKRAQKAAKQVGLSLSSVVNATLNQFAKTGELHVSVAPEPTPYLKKIMKEAEEEFERGEASGPFTGPELIAHLKKL